MITTFLLMRSSMCQNIYNTTFYSHSYRLFLVCLTDFFCIHVFIHAWEGQAGENIPLRSCRYFYMLLSQPL